MEFTGERLVPTVEGYDELFLEHVSRYAFVSSMARGKRVLDAGCGCGYGSCRLMRNGAEGVLGIDLSPEAVRFAQDHYRREGLSFEVRDVLDSGLESASFDLIVGFEVFEHLCDPVRFLSEMRRLLKPSGAFVVSTPNQDTYVAGGEDGSNPYHVKEYTPIEFRELLGSCFRGVFFYAQSLWAGQSIAPTTAGIPAMMLSAGVRLLSPREESTWGETVPAVVGLEECAYMIAVCHPEGRGGHTIPGAEFYSVGRGLSSSRAVVETAIRQRDESIRQLQGELEGRTRWVEDLKREIELRDATIKKLQEEFEERTRWALELDRKTAEQAREIRRLRTVGC